MKNAPFRREKIGTLPAVLLTNITISGGNMMCEIVGAVNGTKVADQPGNLAEPVTVE